LLSHLQIIEILELEPHPEGGYFRETFRDAEKIDGKNASTAIYYLLAEGEHSHWHRIDAAEIWHFYAGAPLKLQIADMQGNAKQSILLGTEINRGQFPQYVIPANWWQSAHSCGAWTLVGCTVAPGFDFSGFEMAEKDWKPMCNDNKIENDSQPEQT
jgi:uncharacterized protein